MFYNLAYVHISDFLPVFEWADFAYVFRSKDIQQWQSHFCILTHIKGSTKVLFVCIYVFVLFMSAYESCLQDYKNKNCFHQILICRFWKQDIAIPKAVSWSFNINLKYRLWNKVFFIAEAFAGEVETFSVLFKTYAVATSKYDSLLNILNSLVRRELCLKISVPSGMENFKYCCPDPQAIVKKIRLIYFLKISSCTNFLLEKTQYY